jgi:hypothetical protein
MGGLSADFVGSDGTLLFSEHRVLLVIEKPTGFPTDPTL